MNKFSLFFLCVFLLPNVAAAQSAGPAARPLTIKCEGECPPPAELAAALRGLILRKGESGLRLDLTPVVGDRVVVGPADSDGRTTLRLERESAARVALHYIVGATVGAAFISGGYLMAKVAGSGEYKLLEGMAAGVIGAGAGAGVTALLRW